ncbi:MAG: hypothetical protein E6G60_20790 [Actinobacteria bacterium]|nr:MAG: hypothetical protein E6G60_20790 [Actinomycetota bacterium]
MRPDIDDHVGDAAVVFDDVEELCDVLGCPPSPAMLSRARERAERMDVSQQGTTLLELWADISNVRRSATP